MASNTQVCFECRTSAKRPKYGPSNALCQKCGQLMVTIPHWAKVPKRRDDKGWKRLYGIINNIKRRNKLRALRYAKEEVMFDRTGRRKREKSNRWYKKRKGKWWLC